MKTQNIAWSILGMALVLPNAVVPNAAAQNNAPKTVAPAPVAAKKPTVAPNPKGDFSQWGGNMYIRTETNEEKARYAAYNAAYTEGRAFLEKKKPDAAIAAFQEAIEIDPTQIPGLEMGQAYAMKGEWEKAIQWYRKDIYPSSPRQLEGGAWRSPGSMLEYALLLLKTGRTAEAITIYNASLYNINSVGISNGESEARCPVSLPIWDASVVDTDPKSLEALVYVGLSTPPAGSRDALAEADMAIKLAPSLAVAHYFRAEELKFRPSTRVEAAAEYRKAAQLGDEATAGAARTALERPEFKRLPPADTK